MDYPRPRLVVSNVFQEQEIPSFGRWLLNLSEGIKSAPGETMLLLLTSAGTAVYGAVSQASYLTNQHVQAHQQPERVTPASRRQPALQTR